MLFSNTRLLVSTSFFVPQLSFFYHSVIPATAAATATAINDVVVPATATTTVKK